MALISAPLDAMAAQRIDMASQRIVDSAASARAAYGAASRATTVSATLASLLQAARAWPSQPAYWSAAARYAARASDSAAVIESIAALQAMHTGRALFADTALQRMAQAPRIRSALNALKLATVAVPSGHVMVTIPDSTIFAEGMDADVVTGALYVASIRHGTVYEIRADGRLRDIGLAKHQRVGAILGVRVAPDGQSLYVTTAGLPSHSGYVAADSTLAAVLRVRIRDGGIVQRWDLAVNGVPHMLGDLAVAADGTVYASDSYAPWLLRIRPGATTFDTITHPLFRSLQGIAVVPESNLVLVADYSHGLLRVNVVDHTVHRVADVPGTTSLGLDGIVWHRGAVIAVQNGVSPARIVRFVLDSSVSHIRETTVIDFQPEVADEPTVGALLGDGFIYVANSQWEKYDGAGVRRPDTQLQPTRLICVSLASTGGALSPPGQSVTSTGRNGTRSTASAPPPSPTCKARDARPE